MQPFQFAARHNGVALVGDIVTRQPLGFRLRLSRSPPAKAIRSNRHNPGDNRPCRIGVGPVSPSLLLRGQSGDLRAFERRVRDQAFFAEHERQDRLAQGLGLVLAAHAFVHDGNTGVGTDGSVMAVHEPVARGAGHEQDHFAAACDAERSPE
jgi:hypothetical protein